MREINKYHVLETIRCYGQISRVEISERTLLSATTVSAITAALIDEGLIEAIHTPPTAEAQRGRPRVLLDLIATAAYVVGVKISETLTTATIANFKGEAVTSLQLPIRIARQTPEVIADLIEDAVRECIAKSGIDSTKIKGIGIGVPGIVDPRSGRSHASSVFGDREMPISALLQDRMKLPVKIEKPANLVALAESWFGYAQRNRTFAVVTVDQTAGLGLWIEDDLHRGASTLGPAFGHIKVGSNGKPCECGQTDCLNAYVSTAALIEAAGQVLDAGFMSAHTTPTHFVQALAERAKHGDAAAIKLVEEQGEMLGRGVSHIVNLVNPEKIIIAIENATFRDLIAPALRDSAARHSFKPHFAASEIIFHTLDEQLWARGAAALMLRDIYSAPWTATAE
ncbi:MAG: ROK family transcriptional regulator [Devosia sp.]